jgi:carbamoyl-phosphate synthase large subunit
MLDPGDALMTRVLLADAGSVAGNNVARSLRAAGETVIVGCSSDRFLLKKSDVDRKYLVPVATVPTFVDVIAHVVRKEAIDVLIPTSDELVQTIGRARDRIPCPTLLPVDATIDLCQDKYELTRAVRARGIPAPRTIAVTTMAVLEDAFARLGAPLWCRLRRGSAGRGASLVTTPRDARDWLELWRAHGVSTTDFMLCDYLPGADYACQSLWRDGELVLVKAHERLSYLSGRLHPSAASTVSAVGRTIGDRRVVDISTAAVRAIDPRATGVFGVDLRADVHGEPAVTEINAGRLYATTPLLDLTGAHNMAATYVKLALGHDVHVDAPYDLSDDYYIVRTVDTPAAVFHADELFDDIEDAQGGAYV